LQAAIEQINNEALSTTQAAAMAGVTAQTMWRWIKSGTVDSFTIVGAFRVWPEDIPAKEAS
jgi:hypothetical protein